MYNVRMRNWLNEENIRRKVIEYSLSGIIVVAFYFILNNTGIIKSELARFFSILMPFIWGITFAFLMFPLFKSTNEFLSKYLKKKTAVFWSALFAILTLLFVVIVFLLVLIPQLWASFQQLVGSFEGYLNGAKIFFNEIASELHISEELLNNFLDYSQKALSFLMTTIQSAIPTVMGVTISTISHIGSIILGFIIAIYILVDKERLFHQMNKLSTALMKEKHLKFAKKVIVLSGQKFNGFVVGKIIDSIIIGIICFVAMSVLKLEYSVLISFIVGLTNVIPVFGPFIGAVPGAFILLIVDPIQALIFVIMVLVLQQVDGNIIGPFILGDSVGISSFWIMFSIIVGGGYFGIVGMFLAVPVFSIAYTLLNEYAEYRIAQKSKAIKED